MTTRTPGLSLAAALLALVTAAPAALASSTPDAARPESRTPAADIPTDRPIVATVLEIDEAHATVVLSTPHGTVSLSVTPDLVERLNVGDVVVVRFTDEDEDSPSASPREQSVPVKPTI